MTADLVIPDYATIVNDPLRISARRGWAVIDGAIEAQR